MNKRRLIMRVWMMGALLMLLWSLIGPGWTTAQDNQPIVRLFFFYSENCEHCQTVINELLPQLWSQYGAQLEIRFFEINDPHNYEVLLNLEAQYHDTATAWPAVAIGQDYIYDTAVEKDLPALIARYLAAGGCDWPADAWSVGATPVVPNRPTPTPGPSPTPGPTYTPRGSTPPTAGTPAATVSATVPRPTAKICAHCGAETMTPTPQPAVYMAYFYDPSCPECQRAEQDLNYITQHFSYLTIERFNIEEPHAKRIAAVLGERLGIPTTQRLGTPAIVIGQDYLVGTDVTLTAMMDLIQKYQAQGGVGPVWQDIGEEESLAAIERLFSGFSPVAVLGAGLLDGLNPCAFATLIFFISYLTFTGRKGRDVLIIGGVFTVSVFVTYLLIGAGILTFLKGLGFIDVLTRIIYGFTALTCLVFGVLSLYDLNKLRQGQPAEMTLQMPDFLKRRTRQLIRDESREAEAHGALWRFVVAAIVAGFGISVLELVCTGQVYLPTIVFVMGVPELAANGFLYLVLYNLMFVTP
ncbi:MAG: hypothetical protein KJ734_04305, partial [Chloroflexi bacterium]|nr:hypothetical protein [Chloroflexota bacterium]